MNLLFDTSLMRFFSIYGLIICALALIPNIIFAKKHKNVVEDLASLPSAICILEIVVRFVLTVVLIVIRMPLGDILCLYGCIVLYLLYLTAWGIYFKRGCNYPDIYTMSMFGIVVPIAFFKSLYFVIASIWLNNILGFFLAAAYALCHVANFIVARKDLIRRGY